MMRLLFDAVTIGSPGGAQLEGELVRALGETCPPDREVVVLVGPDADAPEPLPGVRTVRISRPRFGWAGRYYWYHHALVRAVHRHRAGVVYSLTGILSRELVAVCGTVVSVNNMLPFTPEQMREYPLVRRGRLLALRHLYVQSVRMADAVVLHSKHALSLIASYAPEALGKTVVVLTGVPAPMALNADALPPHPRAGRPYLLYLSALYPYKNHLTLIDGYARATRNGGDLPELFIAGPSPDAAYLAQVLAAIERHGLTDRVRYLGALPRTDVPAWLHHATVNVFPSACETNSLVLAEVLGCRGVLASSKSAPMPEVVGDAAEWFDAHDPGEIASVLTRLCRDAQARADLRERAARRAGMLSWKACGETIWRAAERAADAFRLRKGAA